LDHCVALHSSPRVEPSLAWLPFPMGQNRPEKYCSEESCPGICLQVIPDRRESSTSEHRRSKSAEVYSLGVVAIFASLKTAPCVTLGFNSKLQGHMNRRLVSLSGSICSRNSWILMNMGEVASVSRLPLVSICSFLFQIDSTTKGERT
jgi:hypothetical protein